MKKLSLKWIVVCCGLLFTTTASAQLGNLLKNVLGGNKGTETQPTETEERGQRLFCIYFIIVLMLIDNAPMPLGRLYGKGGESFLRQEIHV